VSLRLASISFACKGIIPGLSNSLTPQGLGEDGRLLNLGLMLAIARAATALDFPPQVFRPITRAEALRNRLTSFA
jgi:hypothetical protein